MIYEYMPDLSDEQLDAQLAVFTAVEKVAYKGKKLAMDEQTRRMRKDPKSMKREVVVNGVNLGNITRAKDSISIYDEDEFGLWAAEHNRGRKLVQIDVTENPELLEVISQWLDENGADWKLTGRADSDLKKGLIIRDGNVLSWDGEVVPGAGVKAGAIAYRDCKPGEVAKVMQLMDQNIDLAGFLGE